MMSTREQLQAEGIRYSTAAGVGVTSAELAEIQQAAGVGVTSAELAEIQQQIRAAVCGTRRQTDPLVQELFENQRASPVLNPGGLQKTPKSWGSSYPGHLLPTDPLPFTNRLQQRKGHKADEPVVESSVMARGESAAPAQVGPPAHVEPPPGWEFVGNWHLLVGGDGDWQVKEAGPGLDAVAQGAPAPEGLRVGFAGWVAGWVCGLDLRVCGLCGLRIANCL